LSEVEDTCSDTFKVEEHHEIQGCIWEWFKLSGQMSFITQLHYYMFTSNIHMKGCFKVCNRHSIFHSRSYQSE